MFRFLKCGAVAKILTRDYGFDEQAVINIGRILKEDGAFPIMNKGRNRDSYVFLEDSNAHGLAAQIAIERLKIQHEIGPPEFPLKKLAEYKAFIQIKIAALAHKFSHEPVASRNYLGRLQEFDYLDSELGALHPFNIEKTVKESVAKMKTGERL